jgi:hypothetical protein
MQSRYRASLGSEIYGESDALGNLWILSEIEGWFSPGSSGQVTQRSARDGAWRSKAYRTARGLTMRGAVISVRDNVGDVLDRVLDSIPLDAPAPLTVYGVNGDDRVMYVRQEGEPDIRILSEYEATFSIGLVSPDGMKYGANEKVASTNLPTSLGGLTVPLTVPFSVNAVTVSGRATCENFGTSPAFPRVLVYGPVTDARLTNVETGEQLIVGMTLEDGEYMDLDFAAHTAYLNGNASRRGYISGTWFSLRPGVTQVAFNSPTYSDSASAQIVWRDTWK